MNSPNEAERPALVGGDIDALAQEVRRVDGNHSLGAGALAEALWPYIAALSLPAAQDGVTFLCDGTRFKLCPTKGGAAFFNFPAELAGKWVALVDATDNRHMRPTPNAIRGDKGAEAVAWQPIETAPEDELVMVYTPDRGNGDRIDFDFREDGVWSAHNDSYEHFMAVGGAGAAGPDVVCVGPAFDAPYTHWKPYPKPPAAPTQAAAKDTP